MANLAKENAMRSAYALRYEAQEMDEFRDLMMKREDLPEDEKVKINIDMGKRVEAKHLKATMAEIKNGLK